MKNQTSYFQRIALVLLAIYSALSLPTQHYAQRELSRKGGDLHTVNKLPRKENRWALIVGVDNYGLKGAVNDAKGLKNALVKYAGFPENQIILLTSDNTSSLSDRNNILSELDRLSRTVPADGLFLFSFSGHGKTIDDNAYLIPSDGRITNSNKLLRDFSIDVTRVKEAIEEMQVKQVVMLIDSCRDRIEGRGNEAEPLTAAMRRGFSFDETNKDVEAFVTLYATRISESAYEYFDRETNQWRGYFSKAIEEGLSGKAANEKGEVTLATLVKYLEETVPTRSYRIEGIKQVPWKTSNGYKEYELVLAIAPKTPSLTGWSGFSDIAKSLLKYDIVYRFSDDLAAVCLNHKCGFINRLGNLVISPKYESVSNFSEGLVCVKLKGKWGYADKTGREVVPPKYDQVINFNDGLGTVRLNDKWGYVDKTGRVVVPIKYEDTLSSSEGLLAVKLNGKFGFIDVSGKVVIPFKFSEASNFSEGIAAAKIDDKWGFIDRGGNVVIRPDYNAAVSFSNGIKAVAVITADGTDDKGEYFAEYQWCFIDKDGELIRMTPTKPEALGSAFLEKDGQRFVYYYYNAIEDFSEGLAVAIRHDKSGFIDRSGKEVIPLIYDECGSFSDGLAQVVIDEKSGFIDKRGREVIPLKYDDVWCVAFRKEGFIGVKLNGKKGFVDIYGNEYFDL